MLKFYLGDLYDRLKLPVTPTELKEGVSVEATLHTSAERAAEMVAYAETQAFLYVLLLMKLIDHGDLKNVSKQREYELNSFNLG